MAKSKKTTPVAEVVESRMARAGDPAGATTFSLSQVPGSVTESIVKPLLTVDNMFNQTHTFEQLDNDFIAQSRANYKINPRLFFNYNSSMLVHTINRIPLIEGSIDTEIENNDDTKLTYDFSSNTYIPSNGGKASTIPTERATYKNQDVIQYKNTTVTNSSLVSGDVVNKIHLVNREIQSNLGLTVSRSEMSHFKNLEAYGEFGDATISKSLFMKPEYTIKINSDSSLGTKTSGYRRLSADFNSSYMPMYFGVDDYSVDGRDEVNGFKHKKMNYNIYTKYFTNRYFSSTDVDPVLHFSKGAMAEDLERPNDANVSTEITSKTGDRPEYKFWRHSPRTANLPKNNYESHTILLADSNKYLDREFGVMTLLFSPSVSTETGVMKDVNYLGMKRRFFTENKSGLGVSSVLRPNDLLGSFPSYQFQSGTTSMSSAIALNKGTGYPNNLDRYRYLKGSNGYGYYNGQEVPWVSIYPNDNFEVLIEGNLKSSMCLVNDDIYSYIYNKTSNPNDIFMNHLMMDIGPSIDMRNYLMVRDSKSVVHIENVPWIEKVGSARNKEYFVYSTSYMSHHGSINALMYAHIQGDLGCIYTYNPCDGTYPKRPLIDMGTTSKSNAPSWEFDSTTYTLDSSRTHSDDDFMTNGIVYVKKEGPHVTGKTGSFKGGSNPILVSTNETFPVTDGLRSLNYIKANSALDGNAGYGGTDILRYGIPSIITSRSSIYPYNAIVSYVTDRYDSPMSFPGSGAFTFAGTMVNPVPLFNTPFNNAINYRLGFNPSHRAGQGLSMLCENQNATVFNNSTGVNYLNTTTDSYAGFGNNAPYVTQKTNMKTIVALTTNASYSKYSLYRPLLKKIVERSTRAREDVINTSIIDIKKKKSFFDPVDNQLYLSTVVPKSESHLPIDNLLVPSERFSNIYARYETNISFIGTRDFNMQTGDNGDFYTYTSLQKDVLGIKFEYMLDPTDDRYVDVHHETGIKTRTFPNGGSFSTTNPIVEVNTSKGMMNELTVGGVVLIDSVRSYGTATEVVPSQVVKSKSLFNDVGMQLVLSEDRYSSSKGYSFLFKWDKFENVCELVLRDNTGGTGKRQLLYIQSAGFNSDSSVKFTGSYGNDVKSMINFRDIEKVSVRNTSFKKRTKSKKYSLSRLDEERRGYNYGTDGIVSSYSQSYYDGANASLSTPTLPLIEHIKAYKNGTGGDVFKTGCSLVKGDYLKLESSLFSEVWRVSDENGVVSRLENGEVRVYPDQKGVVNFSVDSDISMKIRSGNFNVAPIDVTFSFSSTSIEKNKEVIVKTSPTVSKLFTSNQSISIGKLTDGVFRMSGSNLSGYVKLPLETNWSDPKVELLSGISTFKNDGFYSDSSVGEYGLRNSLNSLFREKESSGDVNLYKFTCDPRSFINYIKLSNMSVSSYLSNFFIWKDDYFYKYGRGIEWFNYSNMSSSGLPSDPVSECDEASLSYRRENGYILRLKLNGTVKYIGFYSRSPGFTSYVKKEYGVSIITRENPANENIYDFCDIISFIWFTPDGQANIRSKVLFINSFLNTERCSGYGLGVKGINGFKDISSLEEEEILNLDYRDFGSSRVSNFRVLVLSGGNRAMNPWLYSFNKDPINSRDLTFSRRSSVSGMSTDIFSYSREKEMALSDIRVLTDMRKRSMSFGMDNCLMFSVSFGVDNDNIDGRVFPISIECGSFHHVIRTPDFGEGRSSAMSGWVSRFRVNKPLDFHLDSFTTSFSSLFVSKSIKCGENNYGEDVEHQAVGYDSYSQEYKQEIDGETCLVKPYILSSTEPNFNDSNFMLTTEYNNIRVQYLKGDLSLSDFRYNSSTVTSGNVFRYNKGSNNAQYGYKGSRPNISSLPYNSMDITKEINVVKKLPQSDGVWFMSGGDSGFRDSYSSGLVVLPRDDFYRSWDHDSLLSAAYDRSMETWVCDDMPGLEGIRIVGSFVVPIGYGIWQIGPYNGYSRSSQMSSRGNSLWFRSKVLTPVHLKNPLGSSNIKDCGEYLNTYIDLDGHDAASLPGGGNYIPEDGLYPFIPNIPGEYWFYYRPSPYDNPGHKDDSICLKLIFTNGAHRE